MPTYSNLPSKIPFTNIANLPRPGNPLITYVMYTLTGESTGQEFIWSDADNDYIHVGERDFTVIGTWNASTNTPDHTTALTNDGDALVVQTAGTFTVNGFTDWQIGDLLAQDNGIKFKEPKGIELTASLSENAIPVFKSGTLQNSSFEELTDAVMASKSVEVPQGSLMIGSAVTMSEYGGLVSSQSNITDNLYLPVLYQNEAGTVEPISKNTPFYFNFDPQTTVDVQPVDTTTITNVTEFNITSLSYNHRLHNMRFDFNSAATNLRARVTNLENNNVIKYFPSRAVWESGTGGISVSSGKQEVYPASQPEATPIILPASTQFKIELAADGQIDLQGDASNNPYVSVDVCQADIVFLANENQDRIEITANTTITSANIDTYNRNVIYIPSTQSTDVTITINESLDIDFIDFANFSSNADLTVAVSGSDEINGGSSIEFEQYGGGRIKKITGSEYLLIFSGLGDIEDESERIRRVIGAALTAGTGISITENDLANTITITSTSTSFDAPRITNFSIDIASRVNLNTDLNVQHTLTYDVMHFGSIQSMELDIQTGTNQTLTIPTQDSTGQTQSVTLAGITTSAETTVEFKITGTDTQGNSFESNIYTVSIRTLSDHEFLYYGLSSTNNPASIDIGTMTSLEVTSSQRSYTVTAGPTTQGQYFIVLTPDAETVSEIRDNVLDQNVTDIFTKTEDVRQINSQNFDSYVLGPLNAGASENFIITFS